VLENLADLTNDVASLVELQVRLAVYDLKSAMRRATWPAVVIGLAIAVFVGSLPVALIGLAEVIAAALQVSRAWVLVLIGAIIIALAVAATLLSLPHLRRSFEELERSKEELSRNLEWMKTVVLQSPSPSRRQRG
jgi:hypothetical protein